MAEQRRQQIANLSDVCPTGGASPSTDFVEKKMSEVVTPEDEARHWYLVCRCIQEFHPEREEEALTRLAVAKKEVESWPFGMQRELYFHQEPFHAACLLAQHELEVDNYLERYLLIRDGDIAEWTLKTIAKRRAAGTRRRHAKMDKELEELG